MIPYRHYDLAALAGSRRRAGVDAMTFTGRLTLATALLLAACGG
jgi:hypothetical protein